MTVTVTDLAIARGGRVLLEGIGFSVPSGQALILRGANGIGKTSLLRAIAGLQPVAAGQVDMDEDISVYAGHQDGHKSMLTVAENLSFWAQVFQTSDIEQAMNQFDLGDLRNRLAGTLSAGQKRRLALARLCVTGRKVWILDEPTVSLDGTSVDLFAQAVDTHLGQGGAVVMSTHIDLHLKTPAQVLDLTPYRAKPRALAIDEAFL